MASLGPKLQNEPNWCGITVTYAGGEGGLRKIALSNGMDAG
jgi:hypothetical protein